MIKSLIKSTFQQWYEPGTDPSAASTESAPPKPVAVNLYSAKKPIDPRATNNPDVAKIRESLSGQRDAIRAAAREKRIQARRSIAYAAFGTPYTRADIDIKVLASVPRVLGYNVGTKWTHIDEYTNLIPDEALLRYSEAKRMADVFENFYVIDIEYRRHVTMSRDVDPWLVGHIKESTEFIVLAFWPAPPRVIE